jgi:hypothetical protein
MDTKQTNRTTMFKTVSAYLEDNTAVWNSMAPLTTSVTAFKGKLTEIDAAAQKQETPRGATEDKEEAREAVEDVLFLTCEALRVLGHRGNDHDLLAIAGITASELGRMTEDELSRRAESVLAEANARKTELAALQVTQANLDELNQALQDFNTTKTNPRKATVERMTQTQSLPNLIREASSILRNEIDPMVNLFRRANPDFVTGYDAARVIVDRAASHAAPKAAGSKPPTNA